MGSKPALTTEAIALTEKKMDMSLDDIIKMSKKPAVKRPRGPIKNRGFPSSASSQAKGSNALFMQSRSSALRQGLLAEKRTNFKNQQFSYAKEAARKSSMTPVRTRVNWNKMRIAPQLNQRTASEGFSANKERGVQKQKPKTLDSLFAGMKEQRMKKFRATQQQIRGGGRQRLTFPVTQRQQQQRQQSNGGFRLSNFHKP
ncbi:hypothetical protein AMTRI_Chr01g111670 [Amborella trichopoda]